MPAQTSIVKIPENEVELTPIRSQGAGGQNVNKVASAIHLRFDIQASSLPEWLKQRLLTSRDARITRDGVVVLKAQQFRTQEKNREDALRRLQHLVQQHSVIAKSRKPTAPSRAARRKRVTAKVQRGMVKSLRRKVGDDE